VLPRDQILIAEKLQDRVDEELAISFTWCSHRRTSQNHPHVVQNGFGSSGMISVPST